MEGLVELNDTQDVEFLEEFMDEINKGRNIKMAEQLAELLGNGADQTYFVIVGSMHFVEEPSIVSILEDSGFEVSHVYSFCFAHISTGKEDQKGSQLFDLLSFFKR